MNNHENTALEALRQLLDMTDKSDWHLLHATVRECVREGKFGKEFEAAYRSMVDARLPESSMKFEDVMTYQEWLRANSIEYQGYTIRPGTISKPAGDGMHDVMIFHSPLNATREEVFELGKREVDRILAKEARRKH